MKVFFEILTATLIGVAVLVLLVLIGKTKQKPTYRTPNGIVKLHFGATGRFFCSGTVISPTLVLTAGHCAAATFAELPVLGVVKMPIIVKLPDGTIVDSMASASAADARLDQGLVTGNFSQVKPAVMISDAATNVTMWYHSRLVSCGFPFGAKLFCIPITNISQKDFQFSGESHLYPGMSGGPVFDSDTLEVIGINSAVDGAYSLFGNTIEIFNNLGVPQ